MSLFAVMAAVTTIRNAKVPEELRGNVTMLDESTRIEDSTFDGHDCFRIAGFRGKDRKSETTLWIDQKSFLLRKIDGEAQFDNFRTKSTTTYDPVMNGKVEEKLLAFDAPVAK